MRRQAIIGLKLVASVPLAIVIGSMAGRLLEGGLWPLLFFPDSWLHVVDMVTQAFCQLVMLGGLVWYWALGR